MTVAYSCRPALSRLAGAAMLALSLLPAPAARAQDAAYPAKTTTIVVPFAPGGVTDALARIIAEPLAEQLGKPFVIENKGGAGMIVGALAVSKAQPDGYTLLMATNGTLAINSTLYKALPYTPLKDLVPVSLVGALPFVLLINPELPFKDLRQLIAYAKQQPGKLNFASGGVGSSGHMFGELLQSKAGFKMTHVAYRGNVPALTDTVAGHVQMIFSDIGSATNLVQAGKLKAIAVTTAERFAGTPDIPTMAEAGVPGYEAESWQMLALPAGVPLPIQEKLNIEANKAIATPAVRDRFLKLGVTPRGTGALSELAAFNRAEIDRWGAVVRDAGIAGVE